MKLRPGDPVRVRSRLAPGQVSPIWYFMYWHYLGGRNPKRIGRSRKGYSVPVRYAACSYGPDGSGIRHNFRADQIYRVKIQHEDQEDQPGTAGGP